MTIKSGLKIVQRQGVTLTPAMRQSLAILRMPTQALNDDIAREAEENPFLLVERPEGGPSAPGSMSAHDFALATVPAPENLLENLRRQIVLQNLDPKIEAAALYLVGELREDGYLDATLAEIAAETGAPAEILTAGLEAVQRCEPAGIGARDLAECLALQLADAGIKPALARQAARQLDDFAAERWARLQRSLKQPQPVLERIAALLRGFRSAPIEIDPRANDVLLPELLVEVPSPGKLAVSFLDGSLPRLATMDIARSSLETEEQRALFDRARRMSGGLAARRDTLLRIGAHIVATQSAFFLGKHETLLPVTRAEAAATLSLHPSTLGRALAGKALLADNKVYPLSLFFSHALSSLDGAISPFDIQRRIRAMIAAESIDAPLADDVICDTLQKEGVDIARRTVAKYRKCMRIPSSFGRRRRKVSAKNQPSVVRRGR